MAQDAVNPNALAAPAEGFGQTVSFAFDPQGTPPQLKPVTSSGPRVGASNVSQQNRSSTNVQIEAPPVDPTAALLMKVGGSILAKNIEEVNTKQYVEGMQRAAAGEAIQEVKASVPWYAKLFGDTPVIEGARAYGAQDIVNRTLAEQTGKMKELESLGPNEAAKHFQSLVTSVQTGDAPTDGIVMKAMADQLPALMKAQAKAHYGYNQTRAAKAMGDSIVSGGGALQQFGELYADDKVSDKDMAVRKQQFVMAALPPVGIDEENYQKTLTASMLNMAQAGNFHAINALRESNVFTALTPEQAKRVESAVETAATKARDRYAFNYADTIAQIKSDAAHPPVGQTDQQLKARILDANKAFQKLTGSPVGLFSSDQTADMLTGHFNAFKAETDRIAKANATLTSQASKLAEKAAAAAEKQQIVDKNVADGNIAKLKASGVSDDDVEQSVYKQAKANPEGSVAFLRNAYVQSGYASKLIAQELQAEMRISSEQWGQGITAPPDSFFKSVDAYKQMAKIDERMADSYFGDYAKPLSYAARRLEGSPGNAASIYAGAMTLGSRKGPELPKKEMEALTKKLVNESGNFLPQWLGGDKGLREDAVRRIAALAGPKLAEWKADANLSDEEAMTKTLNEVLGPKQDGGRGGGALGEIIGGYFIERQPGSASVRLADLMNRDVLTKQGREVPDELKGELFAEFLSNEVKVTKDAGTVNIIRQPDVAGTSQFVVLAEDKEGMTQVYQFNSAQLQRYAGEATIWKRRGNNIGTRALTPEEAAAYNEDNKRRMQPAPVGLWSGGPALTGGMGSNPRSIYVRRAEEAKEQAKLIK